MKIEPYKSLIINEKLEASSIAEYHKTILESIMYYQNRKKGFEFSDISKYHSKLIENSVLVESKDPCIYIHEERYNGNVISSLLTCIDITESINGNIIKHENIFYEKKKDMCHCFEHCPIQTEPIMLFFIEEEDTIPKLITEVINRNKETCSFVSTTNREHRYWKIDDTILINKFIQAFRKINKLYVADGHHRLCSIEKLYKERKDSVDSMKFRKIFSNITSVKNINTTRFSRIWEVRADYDFSKQKEHFTKGLKNHFDVLDLSLNKKAEKKEDIIMSFENERFLLRPKCSLNEGSIKSSVDMLRKYIEPLLCKSFDDYYEVDVLKTNRIMLGENMTSNNLGKISFVFSSPSIKEIIKHSEQGYKFPQKSTYFRPKIEDGVVFCM